MPDSVWLLAVLSLDSPRPRLSTRQKGQVRVGLEGLSLAMGGGLRHGAGLAVDPKAGALGGKVADWLFQRRSTRKLCMGWYRPPLL